MIYSNKLVDCEGQTVMSSDVLMIYDKDKPMYNIGYLVRMPYFYEGTDKNNYLNNTHEFINGFLYRHHIYLETYSESIFSNYLRLLDEKVKREGVFIEFPNKQLLREATDIFYNKNKDIIDKFFSTINNDNTLFVHLRSGDKGEIEEHFINILQKLENKYEKIVIISGFHSTNLNEDESKSNLISDIYKIVNEKYIINISFPDIHLCFFSRCKNLLVSKGGFSALGCILFNGDNLYYIPKVMEEISKYNDNWYKYLETNKNITFL